MYLFPPLITEKILLTGYILLMAFSILYLLNAVEDDRTYLTFIAFPFIYNYLFLMGFYNFSLGVAIFMLALGYWWRNFDSFSMKNAVILGILLIALYFCHPLPLSLAMFCIAAIGLLSLSTKFTRWKRFMLSLISMIPAGGLILYYVLTRGTDKTPGTWTLDRMWEYFIRNESVAYHSESQLVFGKIITGVFAALLLYTIIRDHLLTEKWRFALRLHKKDFFLLLFIIFFVVYLKAPDGMSGGGFIKTRMCLLTFLIIIPWFSWNFPKFMRILIGGLFAIFSIAYIAHVSYYHKILNEDIKIYNSGYDAVEKNKIILPLGFDYIGKSWRIGIFTHTPAYYGYKRGGINLINYEASTKYFPTIFKPDFHRPTIAEVHVEQNKIDFAEYKDDIDYIITWAMVPNSDIEGRILQYYDLIKHNGNLKIFRRSPPDEM
jgi:hypothetical protein